MKKMLMFALVGCLFVCLNAFGQNSRITVSGMVADSVTGPISGVNIQIKGMRTGTVTDANGRYSLNGVPIDGMLIFSFIGYTDKEVNIHGKKTVNVILAADPQALDDMVVIGYGMQKRSHFTGATSSMDAEKAKIDELSTGRLDKALQGRLAGVEIRDVSGQVGDAPQIRVRGTASFSASNGPLIVIDGTPSTDFDLSDVDMGDVQNIEVLKDAASTAIFGSRGANGVILITTKKGRNQKGTFNLKVSHGHTEVIKYFDTYTVEDYARQQWNALIVAPWETDFLKVGQDIPEGVDVDGNFVKSPGNKTYLPWELYYSNKLKPNGTIYDRNGAGYYNLNRLNELTNPPDPQESVTNNSAKSTSVFLSATGGSAKTDYYFSAAYRGEEGVMINNHFNSISLTANMNSKVNNKISVEVSLKPKYQKTRRSTNTQLGGALRWLTHPLYHDEYSLKTTQRTTEAGYVLPWVEPGDFTKSRDFRRMWLMNDDFTDFILTPAGAKIRVDTYSGTGAQTAYATAADTEDYQKEYKMNGNIAINWNILPGLIFRTNLAGYVRFRQFDTWTGSFINSNGQNKTGYGQSDYRQDMVSNLINENTLNYDKKSGGHHANFLLGFSVEDYRFNRLGAAGRYYPNDIRVLDNAGEILTDKVISSKSDEGLVSMFGRINYDFKDRYLLSLALRRDGSSQFGENSRWGNFPSVSAGWRVSEEDFFKNVNGITNLTLRASYGVTGNKSIPRYSYITGVGMVDYIIGNEIVNGYAPTSAALGNANIGWEQTNAGNIGLSVGLFKNRINFDLDLYNKKTKALLLRNPIVNIGGQESEWANIGQVSNKGIDFQISSVIMRSKRFSWDLSANASHNINKLLNYGGTEEEYFSGYKLTAYRLKVGQPLGEFYGYKTNGEIWKTTAEINEAIGKEMAYPSTATGDLKIVDTNGDGKITTEDKTVIGSPYPDIEWGLTNRFRYKGFDVAFTFQGSHGSQVQNLSNILGSSYLRWLNDGVYIDEFHGNTPLASSDAVSETDFFVEDASYVALRYVNIGFTIPKTKARVYLSGTNLLYFMSKGYHGINPEYAASISGIVYGEQRYNVTPLLRSVSIGIDIKF